MSIPVQSQNKISWPELIWKRCKAQPAVPIGCVATVGALLGATYHLRMGNRQRFNQFLRLRVYAQGVTVLALMIYGGVAFTGDQQKAAYIKSQIALGDLPPNTPYPGRRDGITPIQERSESTSLPDHLSTALDAPPSLSREAPTGPGGAYPLRKEERMKVSDFARRLREAEALQKEEEGAKRS
ncbi:hypothetical protein CI109_102432 [Kwoniella shandongensis]|uniref:Uncharacterized protein n=1 Tax=Kwoniella shandongensis TaxID=1734106 RepID=A0A5M6C186_9TREE|nr:uncharacterized protein CI109_003249 [Kwoniella shandongensis]KAA5528350.1 hypothetical protein CI109_003249 [Kwoniella shandongensis]